jgi:poly(hydroxyalkanoate) depolymerase family esterase
MRGLHDTISRLNAVRQRAPIPVQAINDHLVPIEKFGTNPGGLRGWAYIPAGLPSGAPLVVVLHGCTQTAAGYDRSSGWSTAADRHGFAVLFPEQQRANNPNLCFSWFTPQHASRDRGEALSIRQMIAAIQSRHRTDPERVFVTGLSAGGAMAAVMLATYPEVFAGGAVIAGLPFGTAQSVPEALDRMRAHGGVRPSALGQLVRSASSHGGPWPILSVWHGTNDSTVNPGNAGAIVDQWRTLHGVGDAPCLSDEVDGYPHRAWCDAKGREVIEEYVITGMGHGTPLSTSGAGQGETAAPYMLEAGISSTQHTLAFWGLRSGLAKPAKASLRSVEPKARETKLPAGAERLQGHPQSPAGGLRKTIEDALRAAGLLDR